MFPSQVETAAAELAPEVIEYIKAKALAEKKPFFIATFETLQQYWSIPIWVYVGIEVYKLWPK